MSREATYTGSKGYVGSQVTLIECTFCVPCVCESSYVCLCVPSGGVKFVDK